MAVPGDTAETCLVHFFGTGLADSLRDPAHRRTENSDRSEPNIASASRVFENSGDTAVVFDPCPGRRRDPSGDLQNPLMVFNKILREYRFMVSNPVAQRPQGVQRPVGLPAGQRGAMWEGAAQRRTPERHFLVGPVPCRHSASRAQQRDPESERQRRHDPVRIVPMPVSRQVGLGVRDPPQRASVETRAAVVVPSLAVSVAKPSVHGVA